MSDAQQYGSTTMWTSDVGSNQILHTNEQCCPTPKTQHEQPLTTQQNKHQRLCTRTRCEPGAAQHNKHQQHIQTIRAAERTITRLNKIAKRKPPRNKNGDPIPLQKVLQETRRYQQTLKTPIHNNPILENTSNNTANNLQQALEKALPMLEEAALAHLAAHNNLQGGDNWLYNPEKLTTQQQQQIHEWNNINHPQRNLPIPITLNVYALGHTLIKELWFYNNNSFRTPHPVPYLQACLLLKTPQATAHIDPEAPFETRLLQTLVAENPPDTPEKAKQLLENLNLI